MQTKKARTSKRKLQRGWAGLGVLALSAGLTSTTGCGDGDDSGDADGSGAHTGSGGGASDLGSDLGSTGGSDGASGGAGGEGGAAACGGEEVTADPVVANVLFVLDKSGSMEATPDGFTKSKWDTLVSSLSSALDAVQDDILMGLELYPSGDTEADVCAIAAGIDVDVAPGDQALADIEAVLEAASPDGQTPTAAVLQAALEYFTDGPGADLEGGAFVVLATDGGPNCGTDDRCVPEQGCQPTDDCGLDEAATCTINIEDCGGSGCPGEGSVCLNASQCLDDESTLSAVKALADAGVQTIVVGMPGSEDYQDVLDRLAVAGGMPAQLTSPKYYKVEDSAGLSQALRDITQGVIRSCDILAEMAPPDPTKVNVFIDGQVIPKNDTDGWLFGDDTQTFIQIVGTYCEQIEDAGAGSISVEYGCPSVIVK